jgi:hypothetical protein
MTVCDASEKEGAIHVHMHISLCAMPLIYISWRWWDFDLHINDSLLLLTSGDEADDDDVAEPNEDGDDEGSDAFTPALSLPFPPFLRVGMGMALLDVAGECGIVGRRSLESQCSVAESNSSQPARKLLKRRDKKVTSVAPAVRSIQASLKIREEQAMYCC